VKHRIVFFLIIGAVAAVLGVRQYTSEAAVRARLVGRFVAAVPDSLDAKRRNEIHENLDNFFARAEAGKVHPEAFDTVMVKLRRYAESGRITASDLLYFMAEVGYYSFSGEAKYNPWGETIDHPTLNPEAGIYKIVPDTAEYRRLGIPLPAPRPKKEAPADTGATQSETDNQ